jgi:hypothetical protein
MLSFRVIFPGDPGTFTPGLPGEVDIPAGVSMYPEPEFWISHTYV